MEQYREQIEQIVNDLLLNKQVLVVSKHLSFCDVCMAVKEDCEDVTLFNLNFCNSANIDNEFYKENFDSIYVLD